MRKALKVIAVPTVIPFTGMIFTETAHDIGIGKLTQLGVPQPSQQPPQPHNDEQQADVPPLAWRPTIPATGGVYNVDATIVGTPAGRFTYEVPNTMIRGKVRVIFEEHSWEVDL